MHWCLVSIVGVAILGVVVRNLVRKLTTNKNVIAHVDEFIGNLGSGVFVMELKVIGRLHGRYCLSLLIAGYIHLFIKFFYFNRVGGFMSPLSFIASYYRNGKQIRFSLFFAATIIITQFVGLVSGQHLARWIWAFEDHVHVNAAAQIGCASAMSSSYAWYYVALCEAFGVLIAVFVSAFTPAALKEGCMAFLTMTMYFFLTHVSGSFFNPIIATAFTFRCAGHTSDWEHIAVYWIAPACSMILGLEILGSITGKSTKKKVPGKTE